MTTTLTLLDPTLDYVFKKMFTADTGILVDLINSVLRLSDERQILTADVKNPDILPDHITQKYIILDISAVDDSGRHYDIEMQVRKYESYSKRAVFYVSKLYSGQLESGVDYEELKPAIGIHFLDYYEFPDHEDFRFCFELRDFRYPELRLTDDIALYIFELRKFEKKRKAGLISRDDMGNWGDWLYFFKHACEEGDKAMRTYYKNPAIHKAFNILETLSADEKVRREAEMREKALKNEISELAAAKREGEKEGMKKGMKKGMKEGMKEGREKEKKGNAKNLLKMGVLTLEQIAEATGLSEEDVSEIQKNL